MAGRVVLSQTSVELGQQAQELNKTYASHYIEYSDWYRRADQNPANTWQVVYGDEPAE